GILITGVLLFQQHRSALWVYAAVLIGTLIWAVGENRFDWWPLAARGDVIYPLGCWLLTPWITRNLGRGDSSSYAAMTLPLWVGVVAGAVVLVVGLSFTYHEVEGTLATADSSQAEQNEDGQNEGGQPKEDWRAYGRTQLGQRYSPLSQITPGNARNLKVAWR